MQHEPLDKVAVGQIPRPLETYPSAADQSLAAELSARVALETRIRASEAQWRSVIESAVDGIIVIDAHGRMLFAGFVDAHVMFRSLDDG